MDNLWNVLFGERVEGVIINQQKQESGEQLMQRGADTATQNRRHWRFGGLEPIRARQRRNTVDTLTAMVRISVCLEKPKNADNGF